MSQFVVRPGETDFDAQGRIQGALDLPMNASGVDQVNGIAEILRSQQLDYIYTSPSEPALSAARQLGESLNVAVRVLDGLASSNLGLWQGLLRSEARQKQPKAFRQWEEFPESVCPPCGEPPEELVERIDRALRKPLRRGGTFAVVVSDPVAGLVHRLLSGGLVGASGSSAAGPGTCRRVEILEPAETAP